MGAMRASEPPQARLQRVAFHALTFATISLSAGLLLASYWEHIPIASIPRLTVGRLTLLLAVPAVALASVAYGGVQRFQKRHIVAVLRRPDALLTLALLGEAIVILVSVLTRGQNTAGALYGYLELVAVAVAAIAIVRLRPRMVVVVLACAAGGALIGCVQALASGHLLAALDGTHGRLAGRYGNPNFLGFAGALAVPVFLVLALRSERSRPAWLIAGSLVGACVFLSYSRGAMLAMGLGAVAALSLTRSGTRRRLQVGVLCGLALGVGALAGYPLYQSLRTNADFGNTANAGTPDRSGWDPRAEGFVGSGPAELSNPSASSLQIRAEPRQGASFVLGRLSASRSYRLTLELSSPTFGVQVGYALEDNLLGNGPAAGSALLRPRAHVVRLAWRPSRYSPNARLYLWLPNGGTALIRSADFAARGERLRVLPLHLLGPADINSKLPSESESHFVRSREDAASLAVRLFGEHPLTGVGWQQFTAYSAARLHYGPLATHDEYLRYAAELGLPGILFLALAMAALGRAIVRLGEHDVRIAAASCVLAGAVGLLFVNALEVPSIALGLFVSAAAVCAMPVRGLA